MTRCKMSKTIEQWAVELREAILDADKEVGFAWYSQSEFDQETVEALSKEFEFTPVDLVGCPCINEDTGKTYYLNKKQGLCYEIRFKPQVVGTLF